MEVSEEFLARSDIIDWHKGEIKELAASLAEGLYLPEEVARQCFQWVRDEIKHSVDYQMNPVTCRATDVLKYKTGFCYAKSHLLAALLRANGIPAGFCYQRLTVDGEGTPYCLHGLNAVWLKGIGWYRIDARGNREGIDARFMPPVEKLAFEVLWEGEENLPQILAQPLPVVVEALSKYETWDRLLAYLPDIDREKDKI
ncbi:MAG: transglutaminase family protein [Deltaproteobacteria bacterium]|nr:transglutaminase family protein [Deltaproteobacteria bacterium]